LQDVKFVPLHQFVRANLAKELRNDNATTSYHSKEALEKRIITDEKVSGFVVQFKLNNEKTGEITDINAGFVLYNEDKKITDMYTFLSGRGNFLFNRIVGFMKSEFKLDKVEVEYDDNNSGMKQFFETAIEKPWDPLKNVVK
jgi:hypothetical protein